MSGNATVLAEMPNLGEAVTLFHKLDDVDSLFNRIHSDSLFLEPARMTAYRNGRVIAKTEKLAFGEHVIVKYKYENLERPEARAQLQQVLVKMQDIGETIQKLDADDFHPQEGKEQRDPNKGSASGLVPSSQSSQSLKGDHEVGPIDKPNIVYYGKGLAVPVIRVKLPGAKKATRIAPGPDRESQERFFRIAEADAERIQISKRRGGIAIRPMELIKRSDLDEEVIEGGVSLVPDDDIPELKL